MFNLTSFNGVIIVYNYMPEEEVERKVRELGTKKVKAPKKIEKHFNELIVEEEGDNEEIIATDIDGNEYMIYKDAQGWHLMDYETTAWLFLQDVKDYLYMIVEVLKHGFIELEEEDEDFALWNLMNYFPVIKIKEGGYKVFRN